jgi:hypothetical protein
LSISYVNKVPLLEIHRPLNYARPSVIIFVATIIIASWHLRNSLHHYNNYVLLSMAPVKSFVQRLQLTIKHYFSTRYKAE